MGCSLGGDKYLIDTHLPMRKKKAAKSALPSPSFTELCISSTTGHKSSNSHSEKSSVTPCASSTFENETSLSAAPDTFLKTDNSNMYHHQGQTTWLETQTSSYNPSAGQFLIPQSSTPKFPQESPQHLAWADEATEKSLISKPISTKSLPLPQELPPDLTWADEAMRVLREKFHLEVMFDIWKPNRDRQSKGCWKQSWVEEHHVLFFQCLSPVDDKVNQRSNILSITHGALLHEVSPKTQETLRALKNCLSENSPFVEDKTFVSFTKSSVYAETEDGYIHVYTLIPNARDSLKKYYLQLADAEAKTAFLKDAVAQIEASILHLHQTKHIAHGYLSPDLIFVMDDGLVKIGGIGKHCGPPPNAPFEADKQAIQTLPLILNGNAEPQPDNEEEGFSFGSETSLDEQQELGPLESLLPFLVVSQASLTDNISPLLENKNNKNSRIIDTMLESRHFELRAFEEKNSQDDQYESKTPLCSSLTTQVFIDNIFLTVPIPETITSYNPPHSQPDLGLPIVTQSPLRSLLSFTLVADSVSSSD